MGVISYTVLIVSEPLRSVTHTMSAEHASDVWITIWGAVVYPPLTVRLARPLAPALGLMPRSAGEGPAASALASHSASALRRPVVLA